MPRVLPNGLDVRAMPQAPNIGDPRNWVFNAGEAMQSAQAGLTLGGEVARIGDLGEQIKLERAKRKAEMAQLDHAELLRQAEAKALPSRVEQALAEAEAAKSQAKLSAARAAGIIPFVGKESELFNTTLDTNLAGQQGLLAGAKARNELGIPAAQAQLEAAGTSNALAGAKADTAFSGMSSPDRAQTLAAAQTKGSWGLAPGESMNTSTVPPVFRQPDQVEEVDPQDGNTYQTDVVKDKRTGTIISTGQRRLIKLGADEKSVTAATKDATALIQTIDLAHKLDSTLETYSKADKGGVGQAMATTMANGPASGPMSVLRKAAGASMQNSETVKVAGEIQNLKNTIGNTLFGSALSKNESENLNGMLPTTEDLADPARAKQKLQGTMDFLESKLKPYRDRGILKKTGLKEEAPTPQSPTLVTQGPQDGQVVKIKVAGEWLNARVVRDPITGQVGYKRL